MQLLGLAWLQLCIVLICICFIRSGLYQEYVIDNNVQLCILMHMYWATELRGTRLLTADPRVRSVNALLPIEAQ